MSFTFFIPLRLTTQWLYSFFFHWPIVSIFKNTLEYQNVYLRPFWRVNCFPLIWKTTIKKKPTKKQCPRNLIEERLWWKKKKKRLNFPPDWWEWRDCCLCILVEDDNLLIFSNIPPAAFLLILSSGRHDNSKQLQRYNLYQMELFLLIH